MVSAIVFSAVSPSIAERQFSWFTSESTRPPTARAWMTLDTGAPSTISLKFLMTVRAPSIESLVHTLCSFIVACVSSGLLGSSLNRNFALSFFQSSSLLLLMTGNGVSKYGLLLNPGVAAGVFILLHNTLLLDVIFLHFAACRSLLSLI